MPTSEASVYRSTRTLQCNNRCRFCPQRELHDEAPTEFPETLDHVAFLGGEPTVDPALVQNVADARARGAKAVLVQTNGRRLMYASYVDELVNAGVSHLDVSLHGHTPEVHDYHTTVEGSFKHTAKGILNANRAGLHVGVTTVVTRSNFRHLPALASLLAKLKVDAWHITAARPLGAGASPAERIVPRLGRIAPALTTAMAGARTKNIRVYTSGIPLCIGGPRSGTLDGSRPDPAAAACALCPGVALCGGPVRDYPQRFADIDLTPLKDSAEARARGGTEDNAGLFATPSSDTEDWFGGIGRIA